MSSDSLAALFSAGGGSAAKSTGILSDMVGEGTGAIRRCGCYLCQGRGLLSGDIQAPGMFSRDAVNVYLDPEIYSVDPSAVSNIGVGNVTSSPAQFGVTGNKQYATDSLVDLNSPLIASQLLNAKWGNTDPDTGAATELTYYISKDTNSADAGGDTFSTVTPTPDESAVIAAANAAFTDVANLVFTEVTDPSQASTANFAWAVVQDPRGSLGVADFPGNSGTNVTSHVVVDRYSYTGKVSALEVGGYYSLTYAHELGHALGMAHPHNGPVVFNGDPYMSQVVPGYDEGEWIYDSELDDWVNPTKDNEFTFSGVNDWNSTPFI